MTEERKALEAVDVASINKVHRIKPEFLLAAVNPRSLEELDYEVLLPKVLEESGVILEALTVWQPEASDPIWEDFYNRGLLRKPYDNSLFLPSPEERSKYYILIKGHRRQRCTVEIAMHPEAYPKTVCDNCNTVPCTVLRGLTETRARHLALDDEAKKSLRKWETVKVLCERLDRDERYQDICLDQPQLLYRALLKNGADRYEQVARVHNGTERNERILKDLRNIVDTWIRTCHAIGPAMVEQLILHFRYDVDKRPDFGDKHKQVVKLSLDNVRKVLKPIYTEAKKEGFKDWSPVTKIAVENGVYQVEGGSLEMAKAIKKLMAEFENPEKKDKGPTPITKSEKADIVAGTRSSIGKSYMLTMDGEVNAVNGKSRAEWDRWAFFHEKREERLIAVMNNSDIDQSLKAIAKAVVEELNMDALEGAFLTANAQLVELVKKLAEANAKLAEAEKKPAANGKKK